MPATTTLTLASGIAELRVESPVVIIDSLGVLLVFSRESDARNG